jgi:hypothetical protein
MWNRVKQKKRPICCTVSSTPWSPFAAGNESPITWLLLFSPLFHYYDFLGGSKEFGWEWRVIAGDPTLGHSAPDVHSYPHFIMTNLLKQRASYPIYFIFWKNIDAIYSFRESLTIE